MATLTPDAQIEYVKQRIIDYFSQVAQIAKDYPPPATNASSGWLRNKMVDGTMEVFGNGPTLELDGDALKSFNAYKYFYTQCQASYSLRANFANSILDQIEIVFNVSFDDVKKMVTEIVAVTTLNAAAIILLVADFKKVADDIKGVEHNGRHLNGWIAVDLSIAADATVPMLTGFTHGTTAAKIAIVLTAALQKLSDRSTGDPIKDGNTPWLRSEWQVNYLAITSSVATGLLNL